MKLILKHFTILIASLVISYSSQAQSIETTTTTFASINVAGETGSASVYVTAAGGSSGSININGEVGGTSGTFLNLNRSTDGQFSRLRFNRNNNATFSFNSNAWDVGMRDDDHFRIMNTTSSLLGGTSYTDYFYINTSTGTTRVNATDNVSLQINGSSKIRAVADGGIIFGTLGVGTSSPDGEVEISHNSTTSNAHLDLNETDANDYARIKMSNAGTDYWDIAGATGTTDKFNLYFYNGSSGNNFLSIDPVLNNIIIDGDVVPGDVAYDLGNNSSTEHWDDVVADDFIIFSDKRLKENILDYNSVLKSVMDLRPVTYKYIDSHNQDRRQRSGFIAQEMQEVFPNVVVTDGVDVDAFTHEVTRTKAEFLSMNYIELIPVLTKAIQEQQDIIQAHDQEVDELKQLIEAMNQRILDLENK